MADFTKEEAAKLLESFKSLGIKPHADTPEALTSWLKSYAASLEQGGVTVEKSQATASQFPMGHMNFQQPRVSVFNGEKPVGKNDTGFDMWRYEVKCLLAEKVHSRDSIFQAVRRSLRGEAGRIAMRLGPTADLNDLLHKLDSVYGTVELKESLLANFYSARQREDEDVSAWSCRLEDILVQAIQEGEVDHKKADEMLRVMFWTGLRQRLKDISGHKFDTIEDFDSLRVAIRQIEHSLLERTDEAIPASSRKSAHVKMAHSENSDILEIKGMIQKLSTDVTELQKQVDPSKKYQSEHGSQQQKNRWQNRNKGDRRNMQSYHHDETDREPHSYDSSRQQGYIVVDLVLAGIPYEQSQECLLLVVPNSNYNSSVPLLLGTNVLSSCMTKCQQLCGNKLLQHSNLSAGWQLVFKSLMMRERHLRRNKNRIGLVKSATKQNVVIQANSSTIVQGYIDNKIDYHSTCALLQPTKKTTIPKDLDITPGVIEYQCHGPQLVDIHLSNVTTRPLTIPHRAVICEIQPVDLESWHDIGSQCNNNGENPLFEELNISSELDAEEILRVRQLISNYQDIFSMGDDIGHTHSVKHRIDLVNETLINFLYIIANLRTKKGPRSFHVEVQVRSTVERRSKTYKLN
ncbi:hypothetical protein ScPMuIL_016309 [Solemya velum]